jgi:membrane fusion protein, multidrug efflux system
MNMLQAYRRSDTGGPALAGHDRPIDRSRLARRLAWAALPVIALAGVYAWTRSAPPAPMAMAAPIVTVATPLQRDVALWDEYVGRFEPSRSVEVRPRVSGQITAIHFTDGQIVKAGQALFTIDARSFQAAQAEAQAGVATAHSDLALAQADLDRALRLVDADAVSKSDVDRLKARVQAAHAALAAAQARLRTRALDVEFATVRAPISGRISDRRIDAGNLVSAGDGPAGTLLTTIHALDPIYFSFEGSEALFLKAKRASTDPGAPVEIKLQDESGYRWQGRLDFTDNGLDPRSGTIRARAVLANRDMFLTPGMFGNMRLASGGTVKALLVPDTAVQTDQTRKILLIVGQDGTVAARPVVLGPVIGGLRVIRSGLQARDRVVITGTQMAFPGSKVAPRAGTITPDTAPPPPSLNAQPPLNAQPLSGQATFAR